MIDFRYHLVSIISIFLALAVGIVLGAGPLKEQIGDTLTQEVTQLRQDKSDLRAQVDAAQQSATVHENFEGAALPRVVVGQLANQSVAMIVLPGARASLVDATKRAVAAAGGALVSTTTVKSSWVAGSDAERQAQQGLASELGAEQPTPTPSPSPSNATGPLDALLAGALVGKEGSPGPSDNARAVLSKLVDQGLIDADAEGLRTATSAVIVAAPVAGNDETVRDAAARRYAALAGAFDAAGQGAVLVSDVSLSGAKNSSSVVGAVRDDSTLSEVLSTVDNGSQSMGQASVVLALSQQFTGGVGQYGLESGVSAPYAPMPTP